MPWWGWVLIGVGVAAVVCVAALSLMGGLLGWIMDHWGS